MTFWRVLRERPADLARVCALTPHARAEHQAAFALPEDLDDLERARRVWVQLTRAARCAHPHGMALLRDPAGTKTPMPGYLEGTSTGWRRRPRGCTT